MRTPPPSADSADTSLLPGRWWLIGTVVCTLALLATNMVPLGIPGEWTWRRQSWNDGPVTLLLRFLPALFGAVVLFGTIRLGVFLTDRLQAVGAWLGVLLLVPAGWLWFHTAHQTTEPGYREAVPLWVPYDPGASGYFHTMVFETASEPQFLSNYEARMRQGDVLHIGTHPPGLFLLASGLLKASRSSPALAAAANQLTPSDVSDAFRQLEAASGQHRTLRPPELAALQWMSLLASLAAAAAVIPIFALMRMLTDDRTALTAAGLWPLMPAVCVFLPKSDVVFPLTVTSTIALMVGAMWSDGSRVLKASLAVTAGWVFWFGCMLSLAHLPAVAVIGCVVLLRAWKLKGSRLPGDLAICCTALAAFLFVSAAWSRATDCNLFAVWKLNLENHAGFYEQFDRTVWKWWLVNPLELAFAAGLPLTITAAAAAPRLAAPLRSTQPQTTPENSGESGVRSATLIVSFAATWVVLWLSGKNSGEAARLWCFALPWILIATLPAYQSRLKSADLKLLFVAQAACCIMTTSRIAGFLW